jgi:hypothetical protein
MWMLYDKQINLREEFSVPFMKLDRLCGLVVRVPGYRPRFPALPDFLRSSGSATGSTQPREDN